jgi:hypothetical protein
VNVRSTYKWKIIAALYALLLTWQGAAPVYASESFMEQPGFFNEASLGMPYDGYAEQPQNIWTPDMVSGFFNARREEGLEMSGEIPEISQEYGDAADFLNRMIDRAVAGRIRAAKDSRARSISFAYEVYSDRQAVSIVLRSTITSATPKTVVDSVNFDPNTGMLAGLAQVVGFDPAPLASKILHERIRSNPEEYNAALETGNIADRPFYTADGMLVILFDEFELTTTAGGASELVLDLSRVSQISLKEAEYRANYFYPVKMIPLERVCTALGYTVEEHPQRVSVLRDGITVSELTPGVNNYVELGRRMRSLEAPPERLADDELYVPISFFDQILSWITYTIDGDDNITFYTYHE